MVSHRFSRKPRIQPPPKVCKSKKPIPPLPPCILCGGTQHALFVHVLPDTLGEHPELLAGTWDYADHYNLPDMCYWAWEKWIDDHGYQITLSYHNGIWTGPLTPAANITPGADGLLRGTFESLEVTSNWPDWGNAHLLAAIT